MTRLLQPLTSGMLLLSIPLVYAAEGDSKLKNVSITDVLNVPYSHSETTISYGPDQFQFGQLWLPTTSPARASLVLIHGGCRLNEFDIGYSHSFSSALAILGHSAAGHLALLAGARSELLDVETDLIVGLAVISTGPIPTPPPINVY